MGKGSSNASQRASLEVMPFGEDHPHQDDQACPESYRLAEGLLAIQHHSAPVCGFLRLDHAEDALAGRLDQVLEATTGSLNSFHRAGGRSSFSDAVQRHTIKRDRRQTNAGKLQTENARMQAELVEFRSRLQSIYAALRGRGENDYADRIARAIWSVDVALQTDSSPSDH